MNAAEWGLKRIDGRLLLTGPAAPAGICLDLADVGKRLRQGRRLALARACGVRPGWSVLDAMAGFGRDGITLAALGCEVTMVERDPLLFQLLGDAVANARGVLARGGPIQLHQGDVAALLAGACTYDAIYFDPMFPLRADAALPKKAAQMLARHVGPPDDTMNDLLARARELARNRVVIKRRRHDPAIAAPHWQIAGRSVRFDVYRGAAASVSET
jgi:16S rRNA (guanine1516-N2)-methyltransferase